MKNVEGLLKISTKGVGYVITEPKAPAIEIEPNNLNTGLPGDRVRVLIYPKKGDEPLTGEVTEIVSRKRLNFVGVVESENGFFYLVPDDQRVYKDILLRGEKTKTLKAGEKAVAKITEWHDPKKDPLGEVVTVIGPAGEHNVEMEAIVYEKGFAPTFPSAVEAAARQIKQGAAEDLKRELGGRRDFRGVATFTIDPADAKDFDDALSLKTQAGGGWEVGIHIADAAHYVKPGNALDGEARRRATSVYLVDRTIPMLPEILSNDLCSLNPREDKLTFSAVFTFDHDLNLTARWFGRTVIHSNQRFTYEEVQDILDKKNGPYVTELTLLNRLAYQLRAAKEQAGAIAFEKEEIKFVLDRDGRPLEVIKKERTDSHRLVEDLMLLANREVAEFVSKIVHGADKKFVYRIHDIPDPDKIRQLAEFIAPLGHRLQFDAQGVTPASINQLLKAVRGTPEENIVHTAAMRTMAKAIYSMKNIGHYGLAFGHYAHFTSPIRRYPDIMVHRLLDHYLRGVTPSVKVLEEYAQIADHASQMELQAQEAERESIRYKQIEYLQDKVGQIFAATISGLAKWGIYVEEQNTLAEGMVRLVELKDDYYVFDEKNYAMVGERTGQRYRLGDEVKVKLLRADLKSKMLDFAFV